MADPWELQVRLLLSIQRALLGHVTPNIRAVTARMDTDGIAVRWIIDGEVAGALEDELSAVSTEVAADFSEHQVAAEFIRCDAPRAMDELYLDQLAYIRKE